MENWLRALLLLLLLLLIGKPFSVLSYLIYGAHLLACKSQIFWMHKHQLISMFLFDCVDQLRAPHGLIDRHPLTSAAGMRATYGYPHLLDWRNFSSESET